jgi:hypothetical protein
MLIFWFNGYNQRTIEISHNKNSTYIRDKIEKITKFLLMKYFIYLNNYKHGNGMKF